MLMTMQLKIFRYSLPFVEAKKSAVYAIPKREILFQVSNGFLRIDS